jgi:hypothetical protein
MTSTDVTPVEGLKGLHLSVLRLDAEIAELQGHVYRLRCYVGALCGVAVVSAFLFGLLIHVP